MMSTMIAKDISGAEALELVRGGHVLQCPICLSQLRSIPETVGPTTGLVCPTNQNHFFVYVDDATAMKEMRAAMKARARS
jgi:hypothetical protein